MDTLTNLLKKADGILDGVTDTTKKVNEMQRALDNTTTSHTGEGESKGNKSPYIKKKDHKGGSLQSGVGDWVERKYSLLIGILVVLVLVLIVCVAVRMWGKQSDKVNKNLETVSVVLGVLVAASAASVGWVWNVKRRALSVRNRTEEVDKLLV